MDTPIERNLGTGQDGTGPHRRRRRAIVDSSDLQQLYDFEAERSYPHQETAANESTFLLKMWFDRLCIITEWF